MSNKIKEITDGGELFDDFLEHYGVKGMKWGKTTNKEPEKVNEVRPQSLDFVREQGYAIIETKVDGKTRYFINENDPRNKATRLKLGAKAEIDIAKRKVKRAIESNPEMTNRLDTIKTKTEELGKKVEEFVKRYLQHSDAPLTLGDIERSDTLEHYGVKGMKWGKVNTRETNTNYDLSSMTPEERQKMHAEMANMAAGGASGAEITAYLEKSLNAAKRRQPGSITFGGKTYTADEWKKFSKEESARVQRANDNHWTQKVNNFAKSLGLKGDIFTTTTTSKNTEKIVKTVRHSDTIAGDFLEHYGVKGMKWGVRKDDFEAELLSLLEKFERSDVDVSEVAYYLAEIDLDRLYTMKDTLSKYSHLLTRAEHYIYQNDIPHRSALDKASPAEIKAWEDKRAKDLKAGEIRQEKFDKQREEASVARAKLDQLPGPFNDDAAISATPNHRPDGSILLTFPERTSDGIGDFVATTKKPKGLAHSDNIVGDFLEHYGVLGMKWGIRKDSQGRRRPTEQVLKEQGKGRKPKHATFYHTDKETGKKVMVDYNPRKVQINRSASGFEVTGRSKKQVRSVAESIRNQLSKGTKDQRDVTAKLNMSDDELRSAINRLQNEKTYKQLTASPPRESSAAAKFMLNTGSQILAQAVTNVGAEYLKQALKVNINKSVAPEYRIKKVDVKEKD